MPVISFSDDNCTSLSPYVGIDFGYRFMKFGEGYGDNLFNSHARIMGAYIGLKVHDRIGVEAGFDEYHNSIRTSVLQAGERSAGVMVGPRASTIVFKSKARMKGPNINLKGYYDLTDCGSMQLIGSAGVSFLKGELERCTVESCTRGTVYATPAKRTLSQFKPVLRLSGGLQFNINQHLGIKTTIGWMNTRKMVFKGDDGMFPLAPNPEVKPDNSVSYNIGIIWNF